MQCFLNPRKSPITTWELKLKLSVTSTFFISFSDSTVLTTMKIGFDAAIAHDIGQSFESAKFDLITTIRTTKLSLQNNNNNNNVLMFYSNYTGLEGIVPYWTFTCIFSWIHSWGNLHSFIIKKISVILEPFQKYSVLQHCILVHPVIHSSKDLSRIYRPYLYVREPSPLLIYYFTFT